MLNVQMTKEKKSPHISANLEYRLFHAACIWPQAKDLELILRTVRASVYNIFIHLGRIFILMTLTGVIIL